MWDSIRGRIITRVVSFNLVSQSKSKAWFHNSTIDPFYVTRYGHEEGKSHVLVSL